MANIISSVKTTKFLAIYMSSDMKFDRPLPISFSGYSAVYAL